MKRIILLALILLASVAPAVQSNAAKSLSMISGSATWSYPASPAPASYTVPLTLGGIATMVVYGDPFHPTAITVNGTTMEITETVYNENGEHSTECIGYVGGAFMRYKAKNVFSYLTINGWYSL